MIRQNRIAICGTAHVHLPDHIRLARDEGWTVAAVFDRDSDRAARWSSELEARCLSGLDAIASGDFAAAIVCSETVHHERDIVALLSAGIPVFSEKPLAHNALAARTIVDKASQSGVLLDAGFFMRTNPALADLRSLVRSGKLGAIIEARARFSHDGAFADWLDLTGWMTDPELACFGGFADEGVHVIDLLQWMLGPVSTGSAVLGHAKGFKLDDHGAAVLTFESGANAAIQAGWTDRDMRLEIDLVGTEGAAEVRDLRARAWRRGEDDSFWQAELSSLNAGEGVRPFLRAVTEGTNCGLVPPEDALAVNAVLDLLYGQ